MYWSEGAGVGVLMRGLYICVASQANPVTTTLCKSRQSTDPQRPARPDLVQSRISWRITRNASPTFGLSRACPLPSYAEQRGPGLPSADRVAPGAGG